MLDSVLLYFLFYSAMAGLIVGYFFWSHRVQRRNAKAFDIIMTGLEDSVRELRDARLAQEAKKKEELLVEARGEFVPEDEAEEIQDEEYYEGLRQKSIADMTPDDLRAVKLVREGDIEGFAESLRKLGDKK
jgi:predicted transcriptional regulator